jgi:hypothetical protein
MGRSQKIGDGTHILHKLRSIVELPISDDRCTIKKLEWMHMNCKRDRSGCYCFYHFEITQK